MRKTRMVRTGPRPLWRGQGRNSGGATGQSTAAGPDASCLFRFGGRLSGSGQMGVRSGLTHFLVRSVSHRPDSGILPVAAVRQQLDATAPRAIGRIIAPRFVRMCSTSPYGPGKCRVPGFSACRIVPGTDFRHSASPSNRKWRCFSGPRECPACPRRFASSRDPSTPASRARPGATGGSWIRPGTETRTPTGRRGFSLDSPLAESGPECRPVAGRAAARWRIPLPA